MSTIKLIPFNEVKVTKEPDQLVKGLIPRVGVSVIWGEPKTGKSFWALDVSVHVARNLPYRGRRVYGGPVVYCCFEGIRGFNRRVEAIKQQYPYDGETPLYVMGTRLDLITQYAELIRAIQDQLPLPPPSPEEVEARLADPKWMTKSTGPGYRKPAAVVLDTLNRSFSGSESSDKDMAAYIVAADAIKETFGCSVIIVHHCGHDAQRPRGHSSLGGAADAQLSITRTPDDHIIAEVEFMKDGEGEGDQIVSLLKLVEIETNNDGDPITSRVVVPCDDAETAMALMRPVSSKQEKALEAQRRKVETKAEAQRQKALEVLDAVAGDDGSAKVKDWREEMSKRRLVGKDARMAYKRIKDGLVASGQISFSDDGLVVKRSAGLRLVSVGGVSLSQ
jgi:hypothetical protein